MEPLPEALRQFIADARVCRIASVRPNGEPHAVPVCPVFDGERVYVDVSRTGASGRALQAEPRMTALFDEYDDDWRNLKAVLLRCEAAAVPADRIEDVWTMIRRKFPQYGSVGWEPRLTLSLTVYDWRQWGILEAPQYQPE